MRGWRYGLDMIARRGGREGGAGGRAGDRYMVGGGRFAWGGADRREIFTPGHKRSGDR